MIVNTKAIVISAVKYGEADLIIKCYTQEGLKSYLLKRILKAKRGKLKPAYFQLLTQLEIVASHNDKGNLNYIKEAKVIHPYETLSTNIIKQTIAMFLSEVLSKSLKEEEPNSQLFQFLETSLIWLDTHDEVSNFHLLFILQLSKHLGFYPDKENSEYEYFDLEAGCFSMFKPRNTFITGQKLNFFKQLIGINFDALHLLQFNANKRQEILDIVLRYFELHLPIFNKPKSLKVLKTIFV